MVRLKSYSSLRPPHPIHLHGFPRTDSYSLQDPGLTPQLPHGTTSAPAEQQAFKKKTGHLTRYRKEALLDASLTTAN